MPNDGLKRSTAYGTGRLIIPTASTQGEIDAMTKNIGFDAVRIQASAFDEIMVDGHKKVILRGVVESASLHRLGRDDYQREAQPLQGQNSIMEALRTGEPLPDIELGMRGQKFTEDGDTISLLDPTFIIDGLQRVTTAMHMLSRNPNLPIRLGAVIHFDTTAEWERNRFHKLNSSRLKVSPNVLLRNMRSSSTAVRTLHALSTATKEFTLYDRVSWGQRMNRGELLTGLTYLKTVGALHTHKSPGLNNNMRLLVPALDRAIAQLGPKKFQDNIRTFFDTVDRCWGVRSISYREGASHLRSTFLIVFARVISDHQDFWEGDDDKLVISPDLLKKIRLFPVNTDQTVINLTGSAGKAREMLYLMLVDHINSGKRTRRLTSRHPGSIGLGQEEEEAAA